MSLWPRPMTVSHLCRRCRFWAGRKPGYQIHLPCQTINGFHAHGWQSRRQQSGQAAQKVSDDDFYELDSDAQVFEGSHRPDAEPSAEQLLEQAAEQQAARARTKQSKKKNTQDEDHSDAFVAGETNSVEGETAIAVDPSSMSWIPDAPPEQVLPAPPPQRRFFLRLDQDLPRQKIQFPAPLDQDAERRDKQETIHKLMATLGLAADSNFPQMKRTDGLSKHQKTSAPFTGAPDKAAVQERRNAGVPRADSQRHATALARIEMMKRALPSNILMKRSHEWIRQRGEKMCVYRMQATVGDVHLSSHGKGPIKELAEVRALRMLLDICESQGLVNSNHVASQLQTQEDSLKFQGKAKLHVYNFCARSLQTPEFNVEYLGLEHARWQCSISWQERAIKTIAFGDTVGLAEVKACNQFKEIIENYELQSDGEQIRLHDPCYLNLDNAGQVLAFHESITKSKRLPSGSEAPVRAKRVPLGSMKWWRTTRHGSWLERLVPIGSFTTDAEAMSLARLITAVKLAQQDPTLFSRYRTATAHTDGVVPATIETLSARLPPGTEQALEDVPRILEKLTYRALSQPESFKHRIDIIEATTAEFVHPSILQREAYRERVVSESRRNQDLRVKQEELDKQRESGQFSDLPIAAYRQQILDMIDANIHSLVLGSTGSGKSTQVAQFILERAIRRGEGARCNVISTQPRRIAAVNLAYRVAQERGESVGEVSGFLISGQMQLAQSGGSITFCTTEILANQLEHNVDLVCDHTTHIIVDEVHVRSTAQTKLLSALKAAVQHRLKQGKPVPRILLMSATLSSVSLREYFQMKGTGGDHVSVPQIDVPGRQFEVKYKYLDDVLDDLELEHSETIREDLGFDEAFGIAEAGIGSKDQAPVIWESQAEIYRAQGDGPQTLRLAATQALSLCRRTSEGSILVFLAGWQEMIHVQGILDEAIKDSTDLPPLQILKLHSNNQDDLHAAAQEPKAGARRIMLSTDIAETSLTFSDVRYIIDLGKVRSVNTNDLDRMDLIVGDVARSSMIQRAGRAGRVKAGEYFGIFPQKVISGLADFSTTDTILHPGQLQALCIRAKLRFPDDSIDSYFDSWITPPPRHLIAKSIGALKDLEILDAKEQLTEYGKTIGSLGVSPAAAKTAILGIAFDCITPALILAASMDQNPIYNDVGEQARFKSEKIATSSSNDHIVQLKCFRFLARQMAENGPVKGREMADLYGLNFDRFLTVKLGVKRLRHRLRQAGYTTATRNQIKTEERNNDETLIAALCFAGRSNHLAVYKNSDEYVFHTQQGSDAQLRVGSLLRPVDWRPGSKLPNPLRNRLACYSSLMNFSKSGQKLVMLDATPVTYLTAILFADKVTMKRGTDDTLLVNDFAPIKFQTKDPATTATLLLKFREKWANMMHDILRGITIRRDMDNRIRGRQNIKARRVMVQMICDLINWEARQQPADSLLREQYFDMYLKQGFLRKGIEKPKPGWLEDEMEIEEGEEYKDEEGINDEVDVEAGRSREMMGESLKGRKRSRRVRTDEDWEDDEEEEEEEGEEEGEEENPDRARDLVESR